MNTTNQTELTPGVAGRRNLTTRTDDASLAPPRQQTATGAPWGAAIFHE
jgi:hypothetical protein